MSVEISREETMNSQLEQVSQSAITVTSENEPALRQSLRRPDQSAVPAPRTVFGSGQQPERERDTG